MYAKEEHAFGRLPISFTSARAAHISAAFAVCIGIITLVISCLLIDEAMPMVFETTVIPEQRAYGYENHLDSLEPAVNVTLDFGTGAHMVNTTCSSVGELLEGQGLYIDSNDRINTTLDAPLSENMVIELDKIDTVSIEITEEVPFTVRENKLQTIPRGDVNTIQKGSDGLVTKHICQTYENGKLIGEELVKTDVITAMVPEVRDIGVGGYITGKDGIRYSYSYYVDVLATAYGGEEFSGLTYSGKQVEVGMVAVDPDEIPLGSKLYLRNVEGDIDLGVMYAEDTGSKIKNGRLDIFTGPDEAGVEAAKKFGRKYMRVYVLD